MNGFERRKEEKKESIRRAALELFKSFGTKKVSVNDIAEKAGVSPVTIYNHFGSKQGLIRDVVKWLVSALVAEYQAITDSDRPYLERWEQMLFQKGEMRHAYHGELIQTILSADPEIREFVDAEMGGRVTRLMADLVEEGKREGYIQPELSLEAILVYIEMVRGLADSRPDVYARLLEDDELFAGVVRLFLYGLMGKETEPDLIRAARDRTPRR